MIAFYSIILAILSSNAMCENIVSKLEFAYEKSVINDNENVVVFFKLINHLKKESIIITKDPWIKEGWDKSGTRFSTFVDTTCFYPFVQLLTKSKGVTIDVYREFPFNAFNNFIQIMPNDSIRCTMEFYLEQGYLNKINFELPVLIEIPYTDLETFTKHRLFHQRLEQNSIIDIKLVEPNYYTTFKKENNNLKFREVFRNRTGFSGKFKLLIKELK